MLSAGSGMQAACNHCPDDIAQYNDNARLRYFRLPDTNALFVT
ncbi:hypothetical protein HMPREF9098_2022 [Kingella denitrificans ATCC 33394]|uniref:Uncharacterized protein n=1 Tax=Kingella denitrificans ATCC 33394 TaxID=888741 RepID=F0F1N7_9NEIS|nr:hypothetical protein HMPREF9098_2022 [Kingella denitrificans ATCC 33394]